MRSIMVAAEKHGAEIELITVRNMNIHVCDGCFGCEKTGACHIKDDMQEMYGKILSADAVMLGSPTYFDAPTSLAMSFIHRIAYPLYGRIKGKRFGSIVVGQIPGEEGTKSRGKVEDYFKLVASTFEMDYIGSLSVTARDPNDASRIAGIEKQCEDLVAKILKK
jgi:multimeric flavodoxin WrbA